MLSMAELLGRSAGAGRLDWIGLRPLDAASLCPRYSPREKPDRLRSWHDQGAGFPTVSNGAMC